MTITIGIDPHKATHTAVAVDTKEAVVGEQVRASASQAAALIDWAQGFEARTWVVESAAGLGYLLAQQLVAAGETVVDVPPVLAARVRAMGSGRSQKNEPNDARSVAIAALRSNRLARVRPDDYARVLGLVAKPTATWPAWATPTHPPARAAGRAPPRRDRLGDDGGQGKRPAQPGRGGRRGDAGSAADRRRARRGHHYARLVADARRATT